MKKEDPKPLCLHGTEVSAVPPAALPCSLLCRQLKRHLSPGLKLFLCHHGDDVSSVSMVMKGEEKQRQQGGERLNIKGRGMGGGSNSESECSNVNLEQKKKREFVH